MLIFLFASRNQYQIEEYTSKYSSILGKGLNELKEFRKKEEYLLTNPSLNNHEKVRNYVKGSLLMVVILTQMNEIYKVISGKSSFSLKLASIRK